MLLVHMIFFCKVQQVNPTLKTMKFLWGRFRNYGHTVEENVNNKRAKSRVIKNTAC